MINDLTHKDIPLEKAEILAIEMVTFLGEDSDKLAKFMETSGFTLVDIKKNIQSHTFLAGVLAYALENESLLLSFCSNKNFAPGMVWSAKMCLENN